MKKILKYAIGTICFLAILLLAVYIIDTTLQFKYEDGVLTMEDFYQYPENSIDVILLGSSHVGSNIDPTQLYSKYGVASYVLWGSAQPTWNTYYFLKEALKTQKPRVVVLETYVVAQDNESTGYGTLVKSITGMKTSEDKYNNIEVSDSNSSVTDLMLGLPTYHSRYSELSELDFERYFWNFKIADKSASSWSFVECEPNDISGVIDTEPLVEKHEIYLKKIIELCKAEGIEVYLYTSPYIVSDKEQMRFNTIANIAEDYGIEYENYNLNFKQYGLDYATDYADALGHMNDSGIAKTTAYLGERLRELYDLPESYDNVWFQKQLDESKVYIMPDTFIGDGKEGFINTGVKLYENPYDSWTLLADIDIARDDIDDSGIYFSCFNEDTDNYGGLLVRRVEDKLNVVVGSNYSTDIEIPLGDSILLAITKSRDSYTISVNGENVKSNWQATYGEYGGDFVIGCELDQDGKVIRNSAVTVNSLEIYKEVWTNMRIKSWVAMQDRIKAANRVTTLANTSPEHLSYQLPGRFKGNGKSTYVDTGLQMYKDASESWTFLMDFNTECDSDNKIYISCFDESGTNYRGLLVRRDEDVINIIFGNATYYGIPFYEDHYARLAIVKDKDEYTIYANGTMLVSGITAPCDDYNGTLLLGAQESNGTKFRMSEVTINRLEVYDQVLEASDIENW